MAHIRESPSLRESTEVITPSGNRYRWADDERHAADTPSGDQWSDTMPGGYETHDMTLPRKPGVDYSDLERLSTVTRYDASGGIIWQGRLERAPRVSGDQVAISPSAVGWQAHLDDDKSAREVYQDIDLSRWTGMSSSRRIAVAATRGVFDPSVDSDTTNGEPTVRTGVAQPWQSTAAPTSEALYDSQGIPLGDLYYAWKRGANVSNADTNWTWDALLSDTDDLAVSFDQTANLRAAGPGTGTLTATTETRVYASVRLLYAAVTAAGAPNTNHDLFWTALKVRGNHGLTLRGTEPETGYYDADIIGHALSRWCPLLGYTDESLTADTFVIPQAAFLDPTTVGEIIRQATRFGLRDWAVWDDLTFWLHDRGARGRAWRARVGPARLEETGPQVDRLWNSIIVAYQDVDGSTRTVGPVGSGADTETSDLQDDDPENPANEIGIVRRDMLTMGTGTAASATQVGLRFLEESKALDSSGRAVFVGHVEDDRGVLHPYSHVHAGDTVVFMDASDTSSRRIVRTQKTRQDRSCGIDIDAPPEGLQALLERLGVVLVSLGL